MKTKELSSALDLFKPGLHPLKTITSSYHFCSNETQIGPKALLLILSPEISLQLMNLSACNLERGGSVPLWLRRALLTNVNAGRLPDSQRGPSWTSFEDFV